MERRKFLTNLTLMTLLLMFIISTFFVWFSSARGGMRVGGSVFLANPVTLTSLIFILYGIWSKKKTGEYFSAFGSTVLILNEIIYYLFWYVFTRKEPFSLAKSVSYASAGFYIGVLTSLAILIFCIIRKKRVGARQ